MTVSKSEKKPDSEAAEGIDSIMSEIDELEQDMGHSAETLQAGEPAETETDTSDILGELQAGAVPDSSLEDTLSEIPPEETSFGENSPYEAVSMNQNQPREENRMGNRNESDSFNNSGTLSMTLQGNMTLRLRYEFGGEEVVIAFADSMLHVQLNDGTEFKIPVHKNAGAFSDREAA